MSTEQVLQNCTVEGMVVKLPPDRLDRETYLEVKKALELIGGKWKGGKTQGFVFQEDPSEYLQQIAQGEKRNLKQEFQFFATPDELADRMVQLADIQEWQSVLEPSAGQGAIIKAILRAHPDKVVYCYEAMDLNKSFLEKIPNARVLGSDFLQHDTKEKYDVIIANPPFNKSQDIDHIYKMFECLREGGKLVTIASPSWTFGSQKTQVQFREWLKELGAHAEEIPAETFKESGTTIKTMLLVIDKPSIPTPY